MFASLVRPSCLATWRTSGDGPLKQTRRLRISSFTSTLRTCNHATLLSPWHAASALSPVCRGARSDLQDRHEQNPQPPVTRELIMTTLLTRGSRGADRDFVLFVSNAYEHVMRSVVLLAERCREVFDTRCSATGFTPVWEQF